MNRNSLITISNSFVGKQEVDGIMQLFNTKPAPYEVIRQGERLGCSESSAFGVEDGRAGQA